MKNGKRNTNVNTDSFKFNPQAPPVPAVFFPAGIDACALYREFIPHINTPESVFILRTGPIDLAEIIHCKVAIVQRSGSEDNWKAIKGMKEKAGMKVVYDLDDNIWSLPPYNPMAKDFKELQHGFAACAELADILTVSTIGLRTAARTGFSMMKPIEVVPNSMDFNLFQKKDIKRDDGKIVIGWGGSSTHSEDVREAFSVVPEVLDKHPQAVMEIVGAPAIETNKRLVVKDGKQVWQVDRNPSKISLHPQSRFRRWVPVSEYPNRLASWAWDIAMAPLLDNRFNRSKSNIKMLEAAALKIPCLVSDVQPYSEFCALDDEVKWLLCRSEKDWRTKLTTLINEPEMREVLGRRMYDIAYRFFNAKDIGHHYQYVFQKALSL